VRRAVIAAAVGVVAAIGGCSSGPEKIDHDKPLPGCDRFPAVLATLGMPSPGPGPQAITTPSSEGVDCSFAPPEGSRAPDIAYASLLVLRPNRDPYEGKSVEAWGTGFAAGATCAGVRGENTALPHGSACYALRTERTGSAVVSTFAKGAGIRVTVQWTNLGGTPDQLRTDTIGKANALAQAVLGML
jgi:hypothetical protein